MGTNVASERGVCWKGPLFLEIQKRRAKWKKPSIITSSRRHDVIKFRRRGDIPSSGIDTVKK